MLRLRKDELSPTSGFQSSVHESFRSSNAQAYDKSLLQKLDSRRGSLTGVGTATGPPPRGFPKSPFSSSANDALQTSRIADEHRQLKPLSLPEMPKRSDSSDEFPKWPSTAQPALSPRNTYLQNQHYYDFKIASDPVDLERSPLPSIRRSGSNAGIGDDASSTASHSHRGSYDQNIFPESDTDFPMEETSGMRRLHIDDPMTPIMDGLSPGSTAGIKRRASSPPREDGVPPSLHSVGSASDLFQRRVTNSRTSPQPFRFHSQSGSVSSTSSLRGGSSYTPNLSLTASSISTMSSFGRLSPGGLSPATDLSESPFLNSSLHSPTSSVSSSRQGHQRNISEARPLMTPRKLSDGMLPTKPQHGGPRLQGIFICECCPKKPKKFDTQEELAYAFTSHNAKIQLTRSRAHEMEKQYECQYCRNRFKNKNEAERHQNSLHLRRHSWSCAALDGYAAAFHASPSALNSSDACGYCGTEFPRSGGGVATDKDWDIRIEHLQNIHKFGECNHAKKFFRADHFRQHLKHSHAGTSGKWTNMLENACMKDEPVPEPIRGHEGSFRASTSSQGGLRPVEEDE